MIIALAGNQNSGKTTLFNALTGSNQHVGNFPGVTVEQKSGILKNNSNVTIVDLPGIYSLSPFTQEEIVTRDFLLKDNSNCIINIVDATNIERNLYLTLQLIELNIPTVIALNMMDEMRENGNSIKVSKLSVELGIPVIPISAAKNEGIAELIDTALLIMENKTLPKKLDFCTGAVHRAIHSITHMIEDHAIKINIPMRFAASKIIEGDELLTKALQLSDNELDILEHTITEMETELDTQRDAALADMRYNFIENICKVSVVKKNNSKHQERSIKIDNLLAHKIFALPIFLCIMLLVFWLSFNVIGSYFSDLLSEGINYLTVYTNDFLVLLEVNNTVRSLVIDGIFSGVGSVLSFLPIIMVLFFFLSLLEDSGYMARVAFIMDKFLRKLGLSGRSFVPLLIGFGCSVPAIMSTRTLGSERDRKMTIILIPFMSCSAKLPIYAVFISVFFSDKAAIVMFLLYITGILVGIVCGLILNKTMFVGKSSPFIMELPPYRIPSLKSIYLLVWSKAKDFLVKAFTVIFIISIIIWFLQSFNYRFNMVLDSGDSMLASLGKVISPVFIPLGFDDWRTATALLTGFTAKEAVVSTLMVLIPQSSIAELFTPLSATSFLIFTLLYTPCVATIAVINRELNSIKKAFMIVVFQTSIAYFVALIFYQFVRLFLK